jgi:DNA mismatch endonuclease (patch repair protein)
MMSRIRGKDTTPELMLRRMLHRAGFRYRTHPSDLPGRPDLVLRKHRAVIFVHGCFWHRHGGCRFSTTPSSNAEFWRNKFAGTVERDGRILDRLKEEGWRVAVVWECALQSNPADVAAVVGRWLVSSRRLLEVG